MKMRHIIFLTTFALISGCGGGGSSSSSPIFPVNDILTVSKPDPEVPDSDSDSESDFYAGIFADSSTFQSACAVPRSGPDPTNDGRPYSDYQGSIELENYWLRSWSNELYLWYDEIVDQNPALYNDPIDYFDTQKSLATTPSGNPRDQFHFTYDTNEWFDLSQSGVSLGYGAGFAFISNYPPRKLIVSYTEPGSPADLAGLVRGTEILTMDGVDFVNDETSASIDIINAALFPLESGENHSFGVLLPGSSTTTVNLVTANIVSSSVLKTDVLSSPTGNVGYILFNSHDSPAEAQLITAVNTLKSANVSDLVLDLRYNGGGYLDIASQMAYMIAGPTTTAGKIFEQITFNDKYPNINPVTGYPLDPGHFVSETVGFSNLPKGQALPSLNLPRVFVLTSDGTCSASEAIINGLRGVDIEVIQIGSTTCGKPYGFYAQDNCGTTYFSIQFSGANDKGFDAYADGFSPQNSLGTLGVALTGCSVADDFTASLGDPLEAQLAAAMQYRVDGTCPTPPAASLQNFNIKESYYNSQLSPLSIAPRSKQSVLLQNKILGLRL